MRRSRPYRARFPDVGRRLSRASAALAVAFLLLPFATTAAAEAAPAPVTPALAASSSSLAGALYWNGKDAATAGSPGTAFSWSFANVATVKFDWTSLPGVSVSGISQADLYVLLLGIPVYTKTQVESTPLSALAGSITMTYDLTQYRWFVQGLYELKGALEDPNGSVVWSETFYVRATVPFDVTVATVALLLIVVAELYMIVTVGPRAADKTRAQAMKSASTGAEPPPPSPPPSGGS